MNDVANGQRGRRTPSDDEFNRSVPRAASGREARVGFFVLIGLVSFIAVLFLLTDPATLRGRYILVTKVEDAGGIRRGDPIQMRGVNIGRIHGFTMRTDGEVDISLEIEGKWKIPDDSRTKMGSAGIFGGRTMEVVPGHATAMFSAGDTILSEGNGAGSGLLGSVDQMGTSAKSVLDRIQKLLNDTTMSAVEGSAAQLQDLLTQLSAVTREQRGTLDRLTKSLASSAEGFEGAGPDAKQAIARADSVMATLSTTSASLDRAATSLRDLLDRINRGEGTLGKLSRDDSLYVNLNHAAVSVAALLDDVRAHPKKYINVSIF